MSRIGKMPITIPSGVEVNVAGQSISVKGPKGTLTHVLAGPIAAKQEGSTLTITRPDESRQARSLHGMSRTMISNMIEGVTNCLLYTSPSPRDGLLSRMPSSA